VNDVLKWMAMVSAIGILLMIVEYRFAKKKKEGFTAVDRKRIVGILWLTIFFALLVGGAVWMTAD